MFSVRYLGSSNWYITDGHGYLHSDGRVFKTREYFPTRKTAQAVLDKFYPKPQHVWEHGDVFEYSLNGRIHKMICFTSKSVASVFYFDCSMDVYSPVVHYLKNAKFLFNIKEKI